MSAEPKPLIWYREPSLWLLLAPLMLIVVVCSVLVAFAVSSPDDRIADDYYKQGKLINKHFAAEQLAQQMNLAADMEFDFQSGEIFLVLQGAPVSDSRLHLQFSHPAEAQRDIQLTLQKVAPRRYRGELPHSLSGRWYVTLQAPQLPERQAAPWRLKGELTVAAATVLRLE